MDVITKFKSPDLRNFLLSFSTDFSSARKPQSHESRVLEHLGPNDIFGELSFIEGSEMTEVTKMKTAEPSLVSFVADSAEVELYVMEGFVLNRIFEWKPQIALRFFKYIAHVTEKRLKAKQKSLVQGDLLTPPATPRTPKGPRLIGFYF